MLALLAHLLFFLAVFGLNYVYYKVFRFIPIAFALTVATLTLFAYWLWATGETNGLGMLTVIMAGAISFVLSLGYWTAILVLRWMDRREGKK